MWKRILRTCPRDCDQNRITHSLMRTWPYMMMVMVMMALGELCECKIREQRGIYSEWNTHTDLVKLADHSDQGRPTGNQIQQAVTYYRPMCEDKILVILQLRDQRDLIWIKCSTRGRKFQIKCIISFMHPFKWSSHWKAESCSFYRCNKLTNHNPGWDHRWCWIPKHQWWR